MCPGRHTGRNENGAPRRVFYRSAGTRHRFGIARMAAEPVLLRQGESSEMGDFSEKCGARL